MTGVAVTALPELYPTKTRLALAHGIARKQVRHYAWAKPQTIWKVDGLTECHVTARVAEMQRHGLAAIGAAHRLASYAAMNALPVVLTDAGWAWLDRHGGNPKGPDQ